MATMSEMKTRELEDLKAEVDGMIREQIRTGGPVEEMVAFRNRIDDELSRRGA
jgi:hypothetical protein